MIDLLRRIEMFLHKIIDSNATQAAWDEAAELIDELVPLRSMLEGDAGGDEKTIKKVLDLGRELCETNYGVACFGEAEQAFSRLSAKAKIGEAGKEEKDAP